MPKFSRMMLAFAATCSTAAAAEASTITFDEVANPQVNNFYSYIETQGFIFAGEHFHIINLAAPFQLVDNGTQYLSAENVQNLGKPVDFFPANNATFALQSAEIGELLLGGNIQSNFHVVEFLGYLLDGSTITSQFRLDRIRDGAGGLPDFQTVTFGDGWSNLRSVTVRGINRSGTFGDFTLDYLSVIIDPLPAVPEPATWGMMLMGFATVGLALRRRRWPRVLHRSALIVSGK